MSKLAAIRLSILLTSIVSLSFGAQAQTKTITTPAAAFGFEPGADRKLADWKELCAYYQKVASESNRVQYKEIGKTEEGRPFVLLTFW